VASERIYRITKAALLKILRRKPVDFDDLVQTTVERVLRSLKDGSFSEECSLPTWVSVVASNVAIDWLRASARTSVSLGLAEGAEPITPWPSRGAHPFEQQLEARSLLRVVTGFLDQMPSERCDPLILHDVHGHDLNEVANIMNISVAAVQSRLVRARYRLKSQLEAAERTCDEGVDADPRRARGAR
jgi:RNA polymerase sigma-70 factor (ECF subfamily)